MPAYEEVRDFSIRSQSHGQAADVQAGLGDKEYTWGSDKPRG